jgi:elongation factor G
VALAFKLEDGRYGQLTYLRIYQGSIQKGSTIVNSRTQRRNKVGRLVRMHADNMEDITTAGAGDIVALFGIDCASGDTFNDESIRIAMTSMHVPAPVISLSIKAKDSKTQDNLAKALGRFVREDPTFRSHVDPESSETIISGMGELHLDVYVERMKREYACEVETGAPQVAYREAISQRAEFNYTHKKQTGGSGQYAKVQIKLEPLEMGPDAPTYEFVNSVTGGRIPREFIPSVDAGAQEAMQYGILAGYPLVGVKLTLLDGGYHEVDSSEMAFKIAGSMAFKSAARRAHPVLLEPMMAVEVTTPEENMGDVIGDLNSRRGQIQAMDERGGARVVKALVPLSEMFGYVGDLRSKTQGRASYSMQFDSYAEVPSNVAKEIIAKATGE